MTNTMKNTLLATVAATALIAGADLASAQGTGETREAPGRYHPTAKSPGRQDGPATEQCPTEVAGAQCAGAHEAGAHRTGARKETPAPTAQAPMKEKPAETAQAPAAAKPQADEHGGNAQTSEQPNSRMAPSTAKDETKSAPPAALSSEQHTKIRDTVRAEKSERLANVPFSTKVGEAIPGTVHLYVLPVSIMEYAPQYRGYEYILVGDEILIADRGRLRIVAVIDA